jgi:hypothetical protein
MSSSLQLSALSRQPIAGWSLGAEYFWVVFALLRTPFEGYRDRVSPEAIMEAAQLVTAQFVQTLPALEPA